MYGYSKKMAWRKNSGKIKEKSQEEKYWNVLSGKKRRAYGTNKIFC